MKILAIDPGSEKSAYVVYDRYTDEAKFAAILDNASMLGFIEGFRSPSAVMAIEKVESYGMAVGETVFRTVWWAGRFVQAWDNRYIEVPRRSVKMYLCNSMKAKDANIRQALLDRFGPLPTKKVPNPRLCKRIAKDEWAALGVAVTAADALKNVQRGRGRDDDDNNY